MLFGRLFDSRRKPKTLADGSDDAVTTSTTVNKLRRNRTVSVASTAKESPLQRKHASMAVPRSNTGTSSLARSLTKSNPTPSRIRTPSPPALAPSPEVTTGPDPTPTPGSIAPSNASVRTVKTVTIADADDMFARALAAAAPIEPVAGPSTPRPRTLSGGTTSTTATSSALPLPPLRRPPIRRGSSAPPSVAGVVRAELDADGLAIRHAGALREEPVLVVHNEQVAEFCAEIGVWEESEAEEEVDRRRRESLATVDIVFTEEPEEIRDVPERVAAAAAAVADVTSAPEACVPSHAPSITTLSPATVPTTPKKSGPARASARRRAQSLISLQHLRRPADQHRRKSMAVSAKRTVRRRSRRLTPRSRLEGNRHSVCSAPEFPVTSACAPAS